MEKRGAAVVMSHGGPPRPLRTRAESCGLGAQRPSRERRVDTGLSETNASPDMWLRRVDRVPTSSVRLEFETRSDLPTRSRLRVRHAERPERGGGCASPKRRATCQRGGGWRVRNGERSADEVEAARSTRRATCQRGGGWRVRDAERPADEVEAARVRDAERPANEVEAGEFETPSDLPTRWRLRESETASDLPTRRLREFETPSDLPTCSVRGSSRRRAPATTRSRVREFEMPSDPRRRADEFGPRPPATGLVRARLAASHPPRGE
jgi:hypothetical protein